ncbi:hypothetical protein B0H13DRAFT_1862540 [Mycena leptocephala]|nr:hypothetical protein B0H13DRAFT_1862540 [Mycena leptocephala]
MSRAARRLTLASRIGRLRFLVEVSCVTIRCEESFKFIKFRGRHPNFLRIIGRSSKTSPDLYLVYHGGQSALSYLASNEYPLEKMDSTDFDLLVGSSGHLQICMISGSTRPWSEEEMRTEVRSITYWSSLIVCVKGHSERPIASFTPMRLTEVQILFWILVYSRLSLSTSTPASQPYLIPVSIVPSGGACVDNVQQSLESGRDHNRLKIFWSGSEHQPGTMFAIGAILLKSMDRFIIVVLVHPRGDILGSGEESTFILSHSTPSPQEMCTTIGDQDTRLNVHLKYCGSWGSRAWGDAQWACRVGSYGGINACAFATDEGSRHFNANIPISGRKMSPGSHLLPRRCGGGGGGVTVAHAPAFSPPLIRADGGGVGVEKHSRHDPDESWRTQRYFISLVDASTDNCNLIILYTKKYRLPDRTRNRCGAIVRVR